MKAFVVVFAMVVSGFGLTGCGSFSLPGNTVVAQSASRQESARVRDAQRLLAGLGYDPGPVDGIFGKRTRQALRLFQQSEGLPVDGVLSDAVLDELRRAAPGAKRTIDEDRASGRGGEALGMPKQLEIK